MMPYLRVASPVTKETPETIGKDALFHLVYTVSAGLIFDAIVNEE